MTPRTCLAIAAAFAAAGGLPAAAQTSLKSGDGYVYAPTTLGSRNPQPYVAEPTASAASGLEAPAERLGSIVEALNAEATLKGSKLTVGPENEEVVIAERDIPVGASGLRGEIPESRIVMFCLQILE